MKKTSNHNEKNSQKIVDAPEIKNSKIAEKDDLQPSVAKENKLTKPKKDSEKRVNNKTTPVSGTLSPKKIKSNPKVEIKSKKTTEANINAATKGKVVTKKSSSISKTKVERKVKVTLELRYHTQPGQSIWITSNGLLLGDSVLKQMYYHDNDHWRLELMLSPELIEEDIHYRYHVKKTDGSFEDDYESKILPIKNLKASSLFIRDFWNYAGYHENVYYKAPFDYLIPHGNALQNKSITSATTHLFQIKVAYLKPNEGICILGSEKILGSWDKDKFQKLLYDPKARTWKGLFSIKEFNGSIEYKYGIYDIETNELIQIEKDPDRRTFPLYEKGLVVQNDGFINIDENRWKGVGLNIPLFSIRTEKDFGVGDFGSIKTLVDWMQSVGLNLLQLLPINDTTTTRTWKDSYPYSTISVFALHPIYLDIDTLLTPEIKELTSVQNLLVNRRTLNEMSTLDYPAVYALKWQLLEIVYPYLKKKTQASSDYKAFLKKNDYWLKAYACFCVLRDQYGSANYDEWQDATIYSDKLYDKLYKSKKDKLQLYFFVQYILSEQLKDAVDYAHSSHITLKGDLPIGVDRYSVDVWQHPQLFNTNMQAGAPPDFFTKDGQNWGFPTYEWATMEKDDYSWWRKRLINMSQYFDALRIDHILGLFRIWSIPEAQTQGILGYFQPCIPIAESEFLQWNLTFDYDRYCKPFINDEILYSTFGAEMESVKSNFLMMNNSGTFDFISQYDTQKKLQHHFDNCEKNEYNDWLFKCLLGLLANVLLIPDRQSGNYHCRFVLYETSSYDYLSDWEKKQFYYLHLNYFFERQDNYWKKIGYQQLGAITSATDMMICGEDLGMVPKAVPDVMEHLGILGLKVQRMASDLYADFSDPMLAGFLNVVTPTTHDMPPIRYWWDHETSEKKNEFYHTQLHQTGPAPTLCDATLVNQILLDHLRSPALWSVFLIQDLLALDASTANPDLDAEIINKPEVPKFYWRYRMHINLEKLRKESILNEKIKNLLQLSDR